MMKVGTLPIKMGLAVGLVTLLVLCSVPVVATEVTGSFSGTMVGYGDDARDNAGDYPHEIAVEGNLNVEQENAVNPRITINSGEYTTLDTSTPTVFVESGEASEFTPSHSGDSVTLSAEEVQSGTTLRVEFTFLFNGGTFDDITPGTVEIEYETPGGTSRDRSFTVDEVTPNMEGVEEQQDPTFGDLTLWQKVLVVIGGLSIICLILYIVYKWRSDPPPAQVN